MSTVLLGARLLFLLDATGRPAKREAGRTGFGRDAALRRPRVIICARTWRTAQRAVPTKREESPPGTVRVNVALATLSQLRRRPRPVRDRPARVASSPRRRLPAASRRAAPHFPPAQSDPLGRM